MDLVKIDLRETFRPTKVARVDSFKKANRALNATIIDELRDYMAEWAEKNKSNDKRKKSKG